MLLPLRQEAWHIRKGGGLETAQIAAELGESQHGHDLQHSGGGWSGLPLGRLARWGTGRWDRSSEYPWAGGSHVARLDPVSGK